MGNSVKFFFVSLEKTDVGKDANVVLQLASFVPDHGQGEYFGVQVTRLASVANFTLPEIVVLDRRPHPAVEGWIVPARGKHARVMSCDLVAAVAGDAGECRINIDDLRTGICDDDAFITIGIHAGRQAQLTIAFAQIHRQ